MQPTPKAPPHTENAQLWEAMAAHAIRDDWPSRRQIYQAFVGATLLLPVVQLPPDTPMGATPSHGAVSFRCGKEPSGEKWTSAFTGEPALRAWDATSPFIRVRGPTLCRLALAAGVDKLYVNLFSGERPMLPGGYLTRSEIEFVAAETIPIDQPLGSALLNLQQPSSLDIEPIREPLAPDVVTALVRSARAFREVSELYAFRMSINHAPWHDTIGIVRRFWLLRRPETTLFRDLMKDVRVLLGEQQTLDVMFVQSQWLAEVRAKGQRLY